ncbi:MAG: GntR family transcriptional regulator [Actinomycetota bacterium]|nr:GntR family transcriptional regulator [Actinomycetota bacterium]
MMPTLADQAHEELRSQLLAGEFAVGEPLAEEATATMLGMSRTPIREALRRLAAEELLVAGPNGGYRPNPPDMSRMRQLYEVRIRLEQLSVELATTAEADRTALERLRDRWKSLRHEREDGASFVHEDESFHVQICIAGGNQVLVSMLRQVNDRIRILRVHDFVAPARVEATITQHLAILDAILGRKVRVASQRMQAHIDESASLVEDRATKAMLRMLRTSLNAG